MWKKVRKKIYHIAIDFDGTCVKNNFPLVGEDIGAQSVLNKLVDNGHKLILNTARGGIYLQPAIDWFNLNNIPLASINQSIHTKNNTSNKVYAKIYIDDYNLGCPLIYEQECKPYVDWTDIESILTLRCLINQ